MQGQPRVIFDPIGQLCYGPSDTLVKDMFTHSNTDIQYLLASLPTHISSVTSQINHLLYVLSPNINIYMFGLHMKGSLLLFVLRNFNFWSPKSTKITLKCLILKNQAGILEQSFHLTPMRLGINLINFKPFLLTAEMRQKCSPFNYFLIFVAILDF